MSVGASSIVGRSCMSEADALWERIIANSCRRVGEECGWEFGEECWLDGGVE